MYFKLRRNQLVLWRSQIKFTGYELPVNGYLWPSSHRLIPSERNIVIFILKKVTENVKTCILFYTSVLANVFLTSLVNWCRQNNWRYPIKIDNTNDDVLEFYLFASDLISVNLTVTRIRKYVPGEDVIVYCNVNVTSNRTIAWFFENDIIWTGDKLNKMSKNSLRYEITEKRNLRIKNTSIDDEGKYTCLPVPPVINEKYTVTLKSKYCIYSLLFI